HILWCRTDYETGTTETVAPPSPALVGRSGCDILPSPAGQVDLRAHHRLWSRFNPILTSTGSEVSATIPKHSRVQTPASAKGGPHRSIARYEVWQLEHDVSSSNHHPALSL